ncbi:hypothetical protein ACHAWF_011153 [Thalassiosira exigua]
MGVRNKVLLFLALSVAFVLINVLHGVLCAKELKERKVAMNRETSNPTPERMQQKWPGSDSHSVKVAAANTSRAQAKGNTHIESLAWDVMPLPEKDADAPTTKLKTFSICACPKCGSTSLFREFFKMVHGKTYESMNHKGPPWIQKLSNEKLWTRIRARRKTSWDNFTKEYSFVLIRDPKERILSAWKSKVKCDKIKTDVGARKIFVPPLLKLAELSRDIAGNFTDENGDIMPCLDLSDYLSVLSKIHDLGREGIVNAHFRPQHLGCFLDAPPNMWTVVTTAGAPNALCKLKYIALRSPNTSDAGDCTMMKAHQTDPLLPNLTRQDSAILDRITREEYVLLEKYLLPAP